MTENKINHYGILLTGGTGSRLGNLVNIVNKHLLTVNNKFIIDYAIESLKSLQITNLIVTLGGNHFEQIVSYLKDGSDWNLNITYVYQQKPQGIAQAINLCSQIIGNNNFSVFLGDNIFEYPLKWNNSEDAQIMLSDHPSLTRFGVASLDKDGKIIKIEEKPKSLNAELTNLAISGCYYFTPKFFEYFKELKPSTRGEYEISEIIAKYLHDNKLSYSLVKGLWSDAGTPGSIGYVNQYFYQKSHGIVRI